MTQSCEFGWPILGTGTQLVSMAICVLRMVPSVGRIDVSIADCVTRTVPSVWAIEVSTGTWVTRTAILAHELLAELSRVAPGNTPGRAGIRIEREKGLIILVVCRWR